MDYIPKIDDYLKILTDEEVEDFITVNFSKYFKYIRDEQNLKKVAKLVYVEILYLFNTELQLINTKPVIKNKLNELLSDLKKFKVQTILVLNCKKRNDHINFHSSYKLIARDSDIDETFKPIHKSIMTKKNCANESCIVFDVIIKHSIKI